MPKAILTAKLTKFCIEVLTKSGVQAEDARLISDVLVMTDTWGTFSHGTAALANYVNTMDKGGIHRSAKPEIVREGASWALVDGRSAMGMVSSSLAMNLAIAKARKNTMSWVGVRNSSHFGAAGYYANMAVEHDMIGIASALATVVVNGQSTYRRGEYYQKGLATNNGSVFNSTYDRGVMLFGDPLPWLNYNAYVVNGTGQNNDDVNNVKDFGGRIDANFASLAEIKNAVIDVGASASKGSLSFSSSTASLTQATEANGATFFSVIGLGLGNLGSTNPTSHRERWGLESALAYGPVKLQTEYIGSNLQGWQTLTSGTKSSTKHFDNDIKNWYADLMWMVTGESYADSYKSGVFGRIRPKHNFDGKDGWGALELGLRYSKFDASDFNNMLTGATPTATMTTACKTGNATSTATVCYTSKADAWTAGAKWLLNPNARIVLNYVHTMFDTPIILNGHKSDNEDAVVLRAQYDF